MIEVFGELTPLGGGDNIILRKTKLTVGRREDCDVVLRFGNVSAYHCRLEVRDGYWYIADLNSRNGVKVNGNRVTEKRIDPGDTVSISKHKFQLLYSPADIGAIGPPPQDHEMGQVMAKSLLECAGLDKRPGRDEADDHGPQPRDIRRRYDILNDAPGQIKKPGDGV